MQAPDTKEAAVIDSLADDLDLICRETAKAAEIALDYFQSPNRLNVQMKEGNSPVSDGDLATNDYLQESLKRARPDYGWLSEETEEIDSGARQRARRTFVVDPIDGTRAYISGGRMWCVSVGIVEDGLPIAGVLVCPVLGETWHAARGYGAFRNDVRLSSAVPDGPIVMAGKKHLIASFADQAGITAHTHPHVPSLAYRIAMVASGQLAGTFVRRGCHDWDIAAAMSILSETGREICDHDGHSIRLNAELVKKPALIAADNRCIETMVTVAEA
ncbi:MAG: 3'(2'),5'-bisphosphate nucleotidase CysQ [Pseudomonadota bacterium]